MTIINRSTLGRQTKDIRVVLAAATADEIVLFVNNLGQDIYITGVSYTPDNAITGDDTNNMALAVRNKGTAGTGTTAITSTRTFNVAGGNVAAMDEVALTLSTTAADLEVAADAVVALNKTEAASGMALSGVITVEFVVKGV